MYYSACGTLTWLNLQLKKKFFFNEIAYGRQIGAVSRDKLLSCNWIMASGTARKCGDGCYGSLEKRQIQMWREKRKEAYQ